jgi:hypothetical protein
VNIVSPTSAGGLEQTKRKTGVAPAYPLEAVRHWARRLNISAL